MTDAEKLTILQTLMEDGGDVPSNDKLNAYLSVSANEILEWIYHLVGGVPNDVTEVPSKYNMTQIYAVIAGYTQAGAEGESLHVEGNTHRDFRYADMLDYIHNHILPYVRVGAVSAT